MLVAVYSLVALIIFSVALRSFLLPALHSFPLVRFFLRSSLLFAWFLLVLELACSLPFSEEKLSYLIEHKQALWAGAFTLLVTTWGLVVLRRLKQGLRSHSSFKQTFCLKFVTIVLVVGGVYFSLDLMGVDLTAVLALGGLGGLALSMAGKEVFSNLIGGVVLQFAQPFAEGDLIEVEKLKVKGKVLHIGFYYTEVLLEDKKVLIPNAAFSTAPIGRR